MSNFKNGRFSIMRILSIIILSGLGLLVLVLVSSSLSIGFRILICLIFIIWLVLKFSGGRFSMNLNRYRSSRESNFLSAASNIATQNQSPKLSETYSYQCGLCKSSVMVIPANIQPLSDLELAICAKENMDLTQMVKVTCSNCNQSCLVNRNNNLQRVERSVQMNKPTCTRCGKVLEKKPLFEGKVIGGTLPMLYVGLICTKCGKIECKNCKGARLEAPCSWCGSKVTPATEDKL
jgi:hypothetical protein